MTEGLELGRERKGGGKREGERGRERGGQGERERQRDTKRDIERLGAGRNFPNKGQN